MREDLCLVTEASLPTERLACTSSVGTTDRDPAWNEPESSCGFEPLPFGCAIVPLEKISFIATPTIPQSSKAN